MNLPLPIYESHKVGEQGEFDIFAGLDEKLIDQLKKYSLDEGDVDLQKNTSDNERFGTGSYENWYKKDRTPFVLVQRTTGRMAALAWLGPEPAHEGCKCHTVAWRSYEPFRGKGIMKPFTKFVLDFYSQNRPNTNFWAKLKRENTGSLHLAEYLGFVVDEKLSDEESMILGKKMVPYENA